MEEQWIDIIRYEGLYQVSNMGRVKSLSRELVNNQGIKRQWKEKIIKPQNNACGYLHYSLCKDGKQKTLLAHRLVAEAFIHNIECKPEVNHKDGNKKNNVVENLEWSTSQDNVAHAYNTGLREIGENHTRAKLSQEQVDFIRQNYIPYDKELGAKPLGKRFGVDSTNISIIAGGKSWLNS